ncbi:MAG: hypothetical protein FWG53_01425, partial [Clostridiales bacterium]|nr:hypothetical protein [Clostridiales bacterium]
MIAERNAKTTIFLLLLACFLLIMAACFRTSTQSSDNYEENGIYSNEIEAANAFQDEKLLDEMRRNVLGIDENEEIDYELFDDVSGI